MSKAVDLLMTSSVKLDNFGYQICMLCNKGGAQKAAVQRHMQEDHIKPEPYWCPKCCVVYSCRGVFYDHMTDVHYDYRTNLAKYKYRGSKLRRV